MKNNPLYQDVRNWIYRNARAIELTLWKYFFEKGRKEDVLDALAVYQNDDGGFGHALEADSWNPYSSPYTTLHAIHLLKSIDYTNLSHPIYQGIIKYLQSEQHFMEYGWRFNIPTNDHYPHAPWWNYSEEANHTESIGLSAGLASFVLQNMSKDTALYKKVLSLVDDLIKKMLYEDSFGDMGIGGFIVLVDTLKRVMPDSNNYDELQTRLNQLVKKSIEHDTTKWQFYGVRPSNYITSPNSIYYEDNKEIVHKELGYLLKTKSAGDVWGITWTWFDNMDKYAKEFAVSENWWKAYMAIEKMKFLWNFQVL